MKLDRIDSEIIALLQNNGRLSNKEIAARVGLAPSSCWERVQRLVADGVFAGFHAEVNPRAVGVGLQAMVAVRLTRHSLDRLEKFRKDILKLPEVVGLYHLAGRDDFLVHVAMRDADQLREFLLARFTTRAEVTHLETHLIFDHVKKPAMPHYDPL